MALNEKPLPARSTLDLPFGGLGMSLKACEEHAGTLEVRLVAGTSASLVGGAAFYEPPVTLFGYELLTVLGCEIRGR